MKLSEVKVSTPNGEGYINISDGINVSINGCLYWVQICDIELLLDNGTKDSSDTLNTVTLQLLENNQDFISNLKKQAKAEEQSNE